MTIPGLDWGMEEVMQKDQKKVPQKKVPYAKPIPAQFQQVSGPRPRGRLQPQRAEGRTVVFWGGLTYHRHCCPLDSLVELPSHVRPETQLPAVAPQWVLTPSESSLDLTPSPPPCHPSAVGGGGLRAGRGQMVCLLLPSSPPQTVCPVRRSRVTCS